ncbi:MAG TPA: TolC family protein [Gemmatimonadales bacterium]|nr:TolC family protein [Gemmatimonadales bacterium]
MTLRRPLPLLLALVAAPLAAQAPAVAPDRLSLLEAIALGRQQAVAATLANMNARVVGTRVGQRRADILPQISGALGVAPQTRNLDEFGIPVATGVTDPFTIYAAQLRASQVIFDASAFTRVKSISDSAQAAGLDARFAGELAGAAAGLAYLRAQAAGETVHAREADSALAANLLDQARRLHEAGVTPVIDLTRNEVNSAAVQLQLLVARNQRDRAQLDLMRALNLPLSASPLLVDSLGTPAVDVPTVPAEAVAYALEHRTDVQAERERTNAVMQTRRAIGYENLPSLGFSGTWQTSGPQTDELSYSYQLQFGLQVPILDGFRRQRRHAEQSLRLEAQHVRQRDVEQQAEQETRQSLLDLASASDGVRIATERLRLAELEFSQADERFRAGVAGSVETTQAQQAVVNARDAVIQSRAAYGISRITLYRSLGVLERLQ